ncbi:uncharacterized protein LOC129223962 [Uloborus diversus]|uniref:uncharacterized protein LOC129223962 n=1 Tax=Uloborus diversus TaxID=327109 RepID=UPI00240A775C|nr:uncharacterized protein LOC129223962 [Uloborus diversus]
MDRNIPDVRDIFGRSTDSSPKKQELRSYDYSPRSRRRHEESENHSHRIPSHNHQSSDYRSNNFSNPKKNRSRHDDYSEPIKQNIIRKTDDKSSTKSKDSSHYSNRTLTERDIRHLERHLSMKKTIRKQISRNLAQAFVDDPELVLNDFTPSPVAKPGNKVSADRTFTLTRAKVSKSEQNVLDLLKDNEPDSGHCSADNPNSSDDDSQEQTKHYQTSKYSEKTSGNSRPVVESNRNKSEPLKDDGKFSFWKMFSVKNRGKR